LIVTLDKGHELNEAQFVLSGNGKTLSLPPWLQSKKDEK
jgi:hypothetical protein